MVISNKRSKVKRIFISYSREATQAHAVSLFQSLVQVLGEKNVFLDVGLEAMEAGRSWKEPVQKALEKCDTLLLVLDPGMTSRLSDPDNAVFFELQTALKNQVTIACVRVDGAEVPTSSSLPPMLVNLPEWHSPEIHSDAVVADIIRITKELTGRVPGQTSAMDHWDLTILGILAALGIVASLSLGKDLLSQRETWLWAGALLIPWFIWMTARRALSTSKLGKSNRNYRQAASWLVVLLIFGTGWLFAVNATYPFHKFNTDSGILVSRLAGDPNNQNQIKLVNIMNNSDIMPPYHVQKLPVRIGFPFGQTSIDEQGHLQAREYGNTAQAAVVLWGKQLTSIKDTTQVSINLTFIKNEALFKVEVSGVEGALRTTDLNALNSNLDHLSDMLPRFLEGYRRYHIAETERDFNHARKSFINAIKAIEKYMHKENGEQPVLEKILASLHFYLGNTEISLGNPAQAINEYRTAIRKTTDKTGDSPLYIEAASNLGWLLREENKIKEATEVLRAIDFTCEKENQQKWACAYAWYNLGYALSDQSQHEQASFYFNLAIKRIQQKPDKDYGDQRLLAYSYQNLAYSLVRHATILNNDNKVTFLDEAQKAWHSAQKVLKSAKLEIPQYFLVTQGRLHIERHQWNQAIDVLTSLGLAQKWELKATVNSLLASAYACIDDMEQSEKYLTDLIISGLSGSQSIGLNISVSEGIDESNRIKKMCSDAS